MSFQWRLLQRRPALDVEIARVNHSAWKLFAPFHYLTADLATAAACYVLFVKGVPAAFAGVLHRPHPRADDIKGVSRLVTLPDYQGLGLAIILVETLGAAHKAIGNRLHTYPAHPALIRSFDNSPRWAMKQKPMGGASKNTKNSGANKSDAAGSLGGRPCAVFQYAGPTMEKLEAQALIAGISLPTTGLVPA